MPPKPNHHCTYKINEYKKNITFYTDDFIMGNH